MFAASSRRSKVVTTLLVLHWCACALFLGLRAPDRIGGWLDQKERARKEGAFMLSSAEPLLFLAERPLYQWSAWHGGEVFPMKIAEAMNLVPLVVTKIFDGALEVFGSVTVDITCRAQSWVSAAFFLLVSSGQWLGIAWLATRNPPLGRPN